MRRMWMAAVVLGLVASGAHAQGKGKARGAQKPAAPAPAPEKPTDLQSEEGKTFYALGYSLGKNISVFAMSPEELALLKQGLDDANAGAPAAVPVDEYGQKIQELAKARQARVSEKFLARTAQEKGVVTLTSGVLYKEVKAGTGASPRPTDTVKVHYRGTLVSGEEFDSSFKRNQPAEFPLNGVITCWTEGLQRMKIGGKAELVCPSETAYGARPPAGSNIPPNAVLRFEVELLGIPGDTSRR